MTSIGFILSLDTKIISKGRPGVKARAGINCKIWRTRYLSHVKISRSAKMAIHDVKEIFVCHLGRIVFFCAEMSSLALVKAIYYHLTTIDD